MTEVAARPVYGRSARRDRLTFRDVEVLGKVPDGRAIIRWQGDEFVLGTHSMSSIETATPCRDDEVRIHFEHEEVVDGTRMSGTRQVRGRQVPVGTYDAYVRREEEKRAQRERAQEQRPADLLDGVGRRLGMFVGAPGKASLPVVNAPSINGTMSHAAGRPAARGPEAIAAWAKAKGIGLSLTPGGRLLVTAKAGHLLNEHRAVLATAERLLVGWLTGHPVKCERLKHKGTAPEAVTVLAIDVAACEDCAR